jgi:NADPH:quinone reductase-like Zn-dependent oxidoreductase
MAGVVDAVGPGASRFRVGDRVMSAVQNHVAELERALSSPNVVPLGQAKKNQ